MYFRNCPKCNGSISYKHNSDKLKADRANRNCKKCMVNNGKFKKCMVNNGKFKKCMVNNGKFKKGEISNTKPIYQCWLDKHGKEVADKRWKEFLNKQSVNNSSKNNSMYGKPTPIGSGNGWSGWYKNWYFRSLLELSYMIKVIERYNIRWETGESKKLTVNYLIDNKPRTYRADFLLNNKYLIDCKPKKLHNSFENRLKREAMVKFCNKNKLTFKFSDIPKLSTIEIIKLYKEDKIKFLNRYESRFKQKYAALL